MTLSGKYFSVAMAVVLSGAATLPSSASLAAPAPAETAPAVAIAATPATIEAASPVEVRTPVLRMAPIVEEGDPQPRSINGVVSAASAGNEIDAELECLAKVVLHEAGNQSRTGQMAVAEVVMNRLQDPRGRFGRSICGVVLQPGQFFNVHAYNGRRDPRWRTAVEIARAVRAGDHQEVTNGGLFFRTAAGAGFAGRTRVATIGAHAFYR